MQNKEVFTEMGLAVLSGWCNLVPTILPPIIWMEIAKHSTNMEDLQQVIGRAVADTASQHCVEINTFHLTDNMLKDIVRMDLAPGGCYQCVLNSSAKSAF